MGMLRQTKVVLIDLSGTIHIDDTEIPGSIEALNRLRKDGRLHLKFVTNTTKESKRKLLERLTGIGFQVSSNEIFTSLSAARQLIDREKLSPLLMIDERAMEDFTGVGTDKKDSVLIGLAPDKFNYEQMNEAFRLVSSGAKLIAIHKARYYKQKGGLALGPGPFVTALEYACDTKAIVVGKPETAFFASAILEFDTSPDRCVMIGDVSDIGPSWSSCLQDVKDDICGAIQAGMKGILVKTGKYREEDENLIPENGKYREGDENLLQENGLVLSNFSEAVDRILQDIANTEGT